MMGNKKKTISPINDYNSIMETNSEFLYKAIETVEALIIRKYIFNKIMQGYMAKEMIKQIKKVYQKSI